MTRERLNSKEIEPMMKDLLDAEPFILEAASVYGSFRKLANFYIWRPVGVLNKWRILPMPLEKRVAQ
jgi:hypothetical protein